MENIRKEGLPRPAGATESGGEIFEYAAFFLQDVYNDKRRKEYMSRDERLQDKIKTRLAIEAEAQKVIDEKKRQEEEMEAERKR